jgi:hypothetical protein
MRAAEAIKLLTRHEWREGDVDLLRAAAVRLELVNAQVGGLGTKPGKPAPQDPRCV